MIKDSFLLKSIINNETDKEATIIQDGEITFMIENREIKGFKWNKKIEKNLNIQYIQFFWKI